MKALQYHSYGGADVLVVSEDVAIPSVESGKVQVQINASSLNRFDQKLREGYMKDMMPLNFPVTINGDFAGKITEIGEGVNGFLVGDHVFGQALIINGGSGSAADVATTKAKYVAKKPKSIDFIQAASLPLVGISALQAIEEHIKLQSGQKIFINGGAGGIGSIAIQIAKMHDAYVAVTVSGKDVDFVRQLGADEVIDYKTQDFSTILHDFDAIFDTAGEKQASKLFSIIKHGGTLVSMVGQPDQALAEKHEVTAIGQSTHIRTENLTRLAQLVDSGKVKPEVEKVFPLEQGRDAFTYFETAHPRGKVVIAIGQ